MRDLLRFIVGLLAPFILIFGGAGLVALGFEYQKTFLLWTGGVVALAGVLWGAFLLLFAHEGDWP